MVLLSITGLFRMVLIILGVFFLLKLIGQLMVARRNVEEERHFQQDRASREAELHESRKNFGKTTVTKIGKDKPDDSEFTDYEEIIE